MQRLFLIKIESELRVSISPPLKSKMTYPQTILVGGWPAFLQKHDVNKKEEPDTFEWMDPLYRMTYEDLRQAVAQVPGAREWLLSGEKKGAVENAIAENASPDHSGASFIYALNQYRLSVQRWDSWVLEMKLLYLKMNYKGGQIKPDRLRWFLNDTFHTFGVTEAEGIAQNLSEHKITFSDGSVPKSWAELKALTTPLLEEFKALTTPLIEEEFK